MPRGGTLKRYACRNRSGEKFVVGGPRGCHAVTAVEHRTDTLEKSRADESRDVQEWIMPRVETTLSKGVHGGRGGSR